MNSEKTNENIHIYIYYIDSWIVNSYRFTHIFKSIAKMRYAVDSKTVGNFCLMRSRENNFVSRLNKADVNYHSPAPTPYSDTTVIIWITLCWLSVRPRLLCSISESQKQRIRILGVPLGFHSYHLQFYPRTTFPHL